MRKIVFVSHSSKDSVAAASVCECLERNGIGCWIDSRDLRPGAEYGEQIIDAIEHAHAVVLLLSSNANASTHVRHEIERAVSKGKAVFPVRIEAVEPARALEFFVMAHQWVDAYMPPLEQRLAPLQQAIAALTEQHKASSAIDLPTATLTTDTDIHEHSRAIITGNRVCLRAGPSVAAKEICRLSQGDEVHVLEQVTINDSRECQLKDDFTFEPESGTPYRLMAGRGFVISGETDTHYRVEIARRLSIDIGYIPKDVVVPLDPAQWYKVKMDMAEGWAFGRYVRAF